MPTSGLYIYARCIGTYRHTCHGHLHTSWTQIHMHICCGHACMCAHTHKQNTHTATHTKTRSTHIHTCTHTYFMDKHMYIHTYNHKGTYTHICHIYTHMYYGHIHTHMPQAHTHNQYHTSSYIVLFKSLTCLALSVPRALP